MALYQNWGPTNVDSLLSTTLSQYRKTMMDKDIVHLKSLLISWKVHNKTSLKGGC
jgi:hypothetical protein